MLRKPDFVALNEDSFTSSSISNLNTLPELETQEHKEGGKGHSSFEGPEFDPWWGWGIYVWGFYVLPLSRWVFSEP